MNCLAKEPQNINTSNCLLLLIFISMCVRVCADIYVYITEFRGTGNTLTLTSQKTVSLLLKRISVMIVSKVLDEFATLVSLPSVKNNL